MQICIIRGRNAVQAPSAGVFALKTRRRDGLSICVIKACAGFTDVV
jgi:hypothetical protein